MKFWGTITLSLAFASGIQAKPADLPKFDDLFRLLRTNLTTLSQEELDHAAVKGLLHELPSQVVLVTNDATAGQPSNLSLAKSSVFDGAFAYFRVAGFDPALPEKFKSTLDGMSRSNKLKGIILDLRYAHGDDYQHASSLADLFLPADQPIMDWGTGNSKSSSKKTINLPLAILVNRGTAGAAEAVAAVLRNNEVGLVIGAATAGQASIFKEFNLETGQKVKIATAPVGIGNGKTVSGKGIEPDIQINVQPEEERAYFDDPYRSPNRVSDTNLVSRLTNTNRPAARRLNEAELVRLQREGLNPDSDTATRSSRDFDGRTMVNDPALLRALDLLKGLAVVQQQRRTL